MLTTRRKIKLIKNDLRRQADQLVRAIEGMQGFRQLALPELEKMREHFAKVGNGAACKAIEAIMEGINPDVFKSGE